MHNRQLHGALAAFAEEAAWQLAAETADGAEIPFEVVRGGRRDSPLYCYRPLTADFIEQRVGLLSRLPSFLPAVHALSGLGRLGDYLESRGERGYPAEPRARAEFALRVFLSRVFEESTDFALSPERLRCPISRRQPFDDCFIPPVPASASNAACAVMLKIFRGVS